MSSHKLVAMNLEYPGFSKSPPFGPRVKTIASMILDSGADCATIGEAGYNQCMELAGHLPGWQYDRANAGGRGLNSVWSKMKIWKQPEDRLGDYTLNSYGQWPRTLMFARLEEVADPTAFTGLAAFHFAAVGAPLGRAGANRAKLAQVKQCIKLVGDRRSLWAGDFPRTDSDDDEILLRRNGYTIYGRVSSTPMCAIARGAVRIDKTRVLPHHGAFDHDYQVIDFTVIGDKEKAA